MQRPDLIIFDCDGVLIDSELMSARALIEEAALHGLPLSEADVHDTFVGRSFPTVARILRDDFGAALPEDFEARYRARLLAKFEDGLNITPGLLPLLERIDVRSCVATSSSPPRVARSLAITGLDRYFGARVYTASEVASGKPAPDLFLLAADRMQTAPARCLVIEDSRPGIAAAQAAGMPVLLYTGGSHLNGKPFDTEPPVRSFRHWDELEHLVPGVTRE